jgi:hypothetical protein
MKKPNWKSSACRHAATRWSELAKRDSGDGADPLQERPSGRSDTTFESARACNESPKSTALIGARRRRQPRPQERAATSKALEHLTLTQGRHSASRDKGEPTTVGKMPVRCNRWRPDITQRASIRGSTFSYTHKTARDEANRCGPRGAETREAATHPWQRECKNHPCSPFLLAARGSRFANFCRDSIKPRATPLTPNNKYDVPRTKKEASRSRHYSFTLMP